MATNNDDMRVFAGTGSQHLADSACKYLDIQLGQADVTTFSDGEIRVQIGENIRGKDVFIMNSTCPPVNHNLMELLIMVDAARRASAARITAVLPYFGYARQDRKDRPRVAITAKLVCNLIAAAGADRVLTLDLHSGQIQGFFDIPVDHLSGEVIFTKHLQQMITNDTVVVSPDTGSVKRAREVANRLEVSLAIVDKRRPKENTTEVMNVIGDVKGKRAILFDDLADTAGTLCNAAQAIRDHGASTIMACCTHAVLSGQAVQRISDSALEEVWVSDSILLRDDAAACPKFRVITFAPTIAEAMRRIHCAESLSILFN